MYVIPVPLFSDPLSSASAWESVRFWGGGGRLFPRDEYLRKSPDFWDRCASIDTFLYLQVELYSSLVILGSTARRPQRRPRSGP
eukprot:1357544-Amorphochlora_amoeboformis.AAC.1